MSVQECALYGDLVLHLRDRVAELLAGDEGNVEAERTRLDTIIRDWFFTPQDGLHGCAPCELIWAEQMGKPNPIHLERLGEFFDDDCPICQAEYQHVKAAIDAGEEHGWQWYYDDGGFPLIARYDPEGWDECWAEEDAEMERFRYHRDFILPLAQIVPPGARLWLQGWLEAVSHSAFAASSDGKGSDDVF